MTLLLHCGAFQASLDDIKATTMPEETKTYKPIHHMDVIDLVMESAAYHGLEVKASEFGLSKDGNKMFGVIDFKADMLEHGFGIGVRNSYDKSMAVGVTAGARNFVCDNLAFSGDFKVVRKHTNKADYAQIVREAVMHAPKSIEDLIKRINYLKLEGVEPEQAKAFILDAANTNRIAPSDTVHIWREFEKPSYEEFANEPFNRYRLLQAFTHVSKRETSAMTLYQRMGSFAELFKL